MFNFQSVDISNNVLTSSIFYMIGVTYAYIISMEVELARLRPLKIELAIVKDTLAMRDTKVASLSQIVKFLQDRLSMISSNQ